MMSLMKHNFALPSNISSIGVSFVAGSPFPSLFMLNIEGEMGRARGNSWKMEGEAS